MSAIEPFRRRAISSCFLALAADGTPILSAPAGAFEQTATHDYRAWPRSFECMSVEATGCPHFRMFLMGVGRMVWEAEPTARSIRMTVHRVSRQRAGQTRSEHTEGIHQDGADYVVSGVVVSRCGVEGGISELFRENQTTPFFSIDLPPGRYFPCRSSIGYLALRHTNLYCRRASGCRSVSGTRSELISMLIGNSQANGRKRS